MIGRPDDAITTSITTAVVMVVAAIGPHDAWRQPILRLIDTVVGVAVGVPAAWVAAKATLVIGRETPPKPDAGELRA
jgi:hypothetical protein